MILDRLQVDQVRIVANATLAFQPRLNVIVGPNGAGKTTLLEAIHLLTRGKSFRRGGLDGLINHAADTMRVQGLFQAGNPSVQTRLELTKGRRDLFALLRDRNRVGRISDISTEMPIQTFLPNAAELVLGGPELRRHWLDMGLIHVHGEALKALSHYRRCLRQRNAALRSRHHPQLDAWDFELGASGDVLTNFRQQYFDAVKPILEDCMAAVCPELSVELGFSKGFAGPNYTDSLAKLRPRDVKLGLTNSGPHRADIQLKLSFEGVRRRTSIRAGTQVSRGQARALAAAFGLAQSMYLCTLKRSSLLMVDDLGSEMDTDHTERFLSLLDALGNQVVATMVNSHGLPMRWRREAVEFKLDAGRLVSVS